MKNHIIIQRFNKLKKTKNELLKLPKNERGSKVKTIEETINRLKCWDKELEQKKKFNKNIKILPKGFEKTKKQLEAIAKGMKGTGTEVSEGMKRFQQACKYTEPTFCESISYKAKNHC